MASSLQESTTKWCDRNKNRTEDAVGRKLQSREKEAFMMGLFWERDDAEPFNGANNRVTPDPEFRLRQAADRAALLAAIWEQTGVDEDAEDPEAVNGDGARGE